MRQLSVSSVLSVRAYTSKLSTGLLAIIFSQMTQIYRFNRTLSLTTHRDLKVVELTELGTGRQVDKGTLESRLVAGLCIL